jgi:hypothetical protein
MGLASVSLETVSLGGSYAVDPHSFMIKIAGGKSIKMKAA